MISEKSRTFTVEIRGWMVRPQPLKCYRYMKKETYHEDEWFFRFLNLFFTHAFYWVIIALMIKWIMNHG